jgi:tetratricopeptide (TPR) repeat protein
MWSWAASTSLALSRDELLPTVGVGARLDGLIEFAWVADRIGMGGVLRECLGELEPATSLWLKAGREILDGQFEAAAATFDEIGSVPDEAEARLRAGQGLLVEGRRAEAGEQFERALAFYRSVGATRWASRCEQPFADSA